jgi:CDP-paratose 2-epimerase
VNATGTLNLLEAFRKSSPEAVFIFTSTNKVYGDRPNSLPLVEQDKRFELPDGHQYYKGIDESMSIDSCLHSVFGASKVAADVMVQEYGRYFGIPSCCLRGGCLTGPNHSGVELHGFLSYLVKCNLEGRLYKVFGYKGKQVRDNIHSHDVARFIEAFLEAPRVAEVYNLGGGRENSCSIWEAFQIAEQHSGKTQVYEYVDENRIGDHICYISDLSKMRNHYPQWDISISLSETIDQIVRNWEKRDCANR